MIDPARLGVFLTAALVLLAIPGPAVTYIVTRSVSQGRLAGFVSALGIGLGGLVHVAAATVGLSALLASSAVAFTVVKLLGAAYLMWLGLTRIFGRDETGEGAAAPPRALRRIFWEGVVVNLLNPKTALFFLAFLPQFVDAQRAPVATQVLFLGTLFVTLAVLTDTVWALAAGSAAGWLRGRVGPRATGRYLTGSIYLGLGLATAFSGNDSD
jgi:threonine/homoserine/homoserine lactone efflux protein